MGRAGGVRACPFSMSGDDGAVQLLRALLSALDWGSVGNPGRAVWR